MSCATMASIFFAKRELLDGRWIEVKYPGQSNCDFDVQCEAAYAGAKCRNSICLCPPRMTAVGGTCRPGTPLSLSAAARNI